MTAKLLWVGEATLVIFLSFVFAAILGLIHGLAYVFAWLCLAFGGLVQGCTSAYRALDAYNIWMLEDIRSRAPR